MPNDRLKLLREKAMRLPLLPGVYIMKNKKGEIIYIGKARLLKNRVSQYFGSQNRHQTKVLKMVENVYDFEHILTASEFEALVLECSLIKQYQPKYNILLKDDKGYCYIRISNDPWRKIESVKRKDDDGATYIGPYMSFFVVNESIKAAQKIFKLPQCNKTFPCRGNGKRPCLNYHMGICSAPCGGMITKEEYDRAITEAIEFLKGGGKDYIRELEERMNEFAKDMQFEKAAQMRDRINAIRRLNEKQKVIFAGSDTKDVFTLARDEAEVCFNVLRFVDGRMTMSENYFAEMGEDLPSTRSEMIKSFYTTHDDLPRIVLLDGECEDMELIEEWLTSRLGKKVSISVPKKGANTEIVSMSKTNAYEALAQRYNRSKADTAVIELGELLGLSSAPEFIESYDISHTAGQDAVGGMVVFKNGSPYKAGYRKFNIEQAVGGDDYGAMIEVLTRRFNHYISEKDTGEGFGRLPDLILMDGGKTQVNAAQSVLESFGIEVPVFGMVKDGKHKTRAITGEGGEIAISATRRVFTLVSGIQEEVHRFAIGFHHSKHIKNAKRGELEQIYGIGPKKAEILWREYKTLEAIKSADMDSLAAIPGISVQDALSICKHFS